MTQIRERYWLRPKPYGHDKLFEVCVSFDHPTLLVYCHEVDPSSGDTVWHPQYKERFTWNGAAYYCFIETYAAPAEHGHRSGEWFFHWLYHAIDRLDLPGPVRMGLKIVPEQWDNKAEYRHWERKHQFWGGVLGIPIDAPHYDTARRDWPTYEGVLADPSPHAEYSERLVVEPVDLDWSRNKDAAARREVLVANNASRPADAAPIGFLSWLLRLLTGR